MTNTTVSATRLSEAGAPTAPNLTESSHTDPAQKRPLPALHAQKGPPSAFENSAIALPKTKLMMAVSFMTMFRAGPEVSFSGSPTVSPVTEFLCASEPLQNSLPRPPAEMYFLELSQAPPVLLMEMASCTLETSAPDRSPAQSSPGAKPPWRS